MRKSLRIILEAVHTQHRQSAEQAGDIKRSRMSPRTGVRGQRAKGYDSGENKQRVVHCLEQTSRAIHAEGGEQRCG